MADGSFSGEASACFLSLCDKVSASLLCSLGAVKSPFCSCVSFKNKAHVSRRLCKFKSYLVVHGVEDVKVKIIPRWANWQMEDVASLTRALPLSDGFVRGESCSKASNLPNLVNCLRERLTCVFYW